MYCVHMNARKPRSSCILCGKEPARSGYTYCSNACQHEYQYQTFIKKWKRGEAQGLNSMGLVSDSVKRFLREKYQNKCCLCEWSKVNPKTGVAPLVADHIDGNWQNNIESNLRLICPNCDALNPTYAGLNRGSGRGSRAPSNRMLAAREIRKAELAQK